MTPLRRAWSRNWPRFAKPAKIDVSGMVSRDSALTAKLHMDRGAGRSTGGGSRRNPGRVFIEVQYSVFFRAEPPNTSLVKDEGG